jgi:hypothetical protein
LIEDGGVRAGIVALGLASVAENVSLVWLLLHENVDMLCDMQKLTHPVEHGPSRKREREGHLRREAVPQQVLDVLTSAAVAVLFEVALPIHENGHLIQLRMVENVGTRETKVLFEKYRNSPDGEMGYAEKFSVFQAGDEIVRVGSATVRDAPLDAVLAVLEEKAASKWRTHVVQRKTEGPLPICARSLHASDEAFS